MKVYLYDDYKVYIYSLPTKIEDAFIINYTSYMGVEETIVINARDGKWTISSNESMTLLKNNMKADEENLNGNDFFKIKFGDLDYYLSIICFSSPLQYFDYSVPSLEGFTLGKSSSSQIIYDNSSVLASHIRFYKNGGYWYVDDFNNSNAVMFVNNVRTKIKPLTMGDVIFVHGLKIIWMNDFIRINSPNNLVKSSLSAYKQFGEESENKYSPITDSERGIVLYNESQAFFHTPSIKETIVNKTISITNPPAKRSSDEPPAILTLGSTIMMGLSSSITGVISLFSITKGNIMVGIIQGLMCLITLAGSILFPVLLSGYEKRKSKRLEKIRQTKYLEYLENKKKEINDEIAEEIKILYKNNLSVIECENFIANRSSIWTREISDNDFLTFRLGIGKRKASITLNSSISDFDIEGDNLHEEVVKLINTPLILDEVPITISLIENRILPFIVSPSFNRKQFIDYLMLQLMTYHSSVDLKLVIFTDDSNSFYWDHMKYTPYCYSRDRSKHFFATNEDEMKMVSSSLEDIYNTRILTLNNGNEDDKEINDSHDDLYKKFDEYYLIITDCFISTKKLGIIEKVLDEDSNIGFSLITIEPSMKNVPSKCNKFVEIDDIGMITDKDLSNTDIVSFKVEVMDNALIEDYSFVIANMPISLTTSGSSLPTSINFLEMYKAGNIEQLNIVNRWLSNNPTASLSTPIGVDGDGKLFTLDLHEKFQGPHGLIAGSTGSGKSEFIITFILSMAVNYHPYEVQFVLIDYKGGGLAGAFENRETGVKIPHLAGTITNLDTAEMNRTLVSIKSELKRRQRLFNEARDSLGEGTIDIYKYQKLFREGKVKEPISHLFIVSDEFAELKSQQPDFMEELVSTARIGRSLGVHLILATQKPAGVVDDQIWSNSRFKVCLKVQTPEDSNELLKRPEAATIKETGRFYLQIGYNESFELGQSAWAGAKYNPTTRILKSVDDSIKFIDNSGTVLKTVNDVIVSNSSKNLGDQLTNIVKTLYDIGVREKLKCTPLWLPSIPKEIYLKDLIEKYQYKAEPYLINPLVGEYDIPMEQLQKPLIIDFSNVGNLLICGMTGSGKENLLTTIIYSICICHATEEVNFYLLDFGAETLKAFQNFPQVGNVILSDDIEKVVNVFTMLDKEITKRKELFSEFGGSYMSYIKESGKKLPLIITVLNAFETYAESSDEYLDYFNALLRDGYKYGVVFVMTATLINSVPTKMVQNFGNIIATQFADPDDYRFHLGAPLGLIPSKCFGRGLIKVDSTCYEFQSALIYLKEKINDAIKSMSETLNGMYKTRARKVPVIPKNITPEMLLPHAEDGSNVPIGYNDYDGELVKFDFYKSKITQVLGTSLLFNNGFVCGLINLIGSIPSVKVRVVDFADTIKNINPDIEYHNDEFTATISSITAEENNTPSKIVTFLVGLGYIQDRVLDEGIAELFGLLENAQNLKNTYFVIVDNYSTIRKISNENFFNNISKKDGIWIGSGIDVQTMFTVNNLSKGDILTEDNSKIGYIIENSEYKVCKCLSVEGDDSY